MAVYSSPGQRSSRSRLRSCARSVGRGKSVSFSQTAQPCLAVGLTAPAAPIHGPRPGPVPAGDVWPEARPGRGGPRRLHRGALPPQAGRRTMPAVLGRPVGLLTRARQISFRSRGIAPQHSHSLCLIRQVPGGLVVPDRQAVRSFCVRPDPRTPKACFLARRNASLWLSGIRKDERDAGIAWSILIRDTSRGTRATAGVCGGAPSPPTNRLQKLPVSVCRSTCL